MGVFLDTLVAFPDLEGLTVTYETWQDETLNDFEAGQTSAGVERNTNEARWQSTAVTTGHDPTACRHASSST